jgi:hypothetical protein
MKIYSLFHLNTSFSSIDEKSIPELINRCYWPILKLSEENNIKLSIEASASTLIKINKLDSRWIKKFKEMIINDQCELIGSGFHQIIYPLTPYELNMYNLKRGDKIYKELLNYKPKVALVNEQAFSSSIINIYIKNGYNKIILDWNNSFKANKNWNETIKERVCIAKDKNNNQIEIIWNNSINSQKFQKYAYNDISLKEYIKILSIKKNINLCLYGSDAEVFNFRPKRFLNENKIENDEWKRIKDLYLYLKNKKNEFIFIKNIKKKTKKIFLNNITNAEHPIIVKKQKKYNVVRWALTGKDSLRLNTFCWKFFLKIKNIKNKKKWDELCDLWKSDYRTHLTKKKWSIVNKKISANYKEKTFFKSSLSQINIEKKDDLLLGNKNIEVMLSRKKGLTIKSYKNYKISDKALFGITQQGFFNYVDLDVDFFSAHFTHDCENKKITDVSFKPKKIFINKNKNLIMFKNKTLNYKKIIAIVGNKLQLYISLNSKAAGITRLFYITLNPNSFDKSTLFYACKNGSNSYEKFHLKDSNGFDHGAHVSKIVSANTCLGATDNKIILGDKKKYLSIKIDRKLSCLYPMIQFLKINNKKLLRVFFSCSEQDDTSKNRKLKLDAKIEIESKLNNKF